MAVQMVLFRTSHFCKDILLLETLCSSNRLRVIVKPQNASRFNPFCEKINLDVSNKLLVPAIPSEGYVFQVERMNQDRSYMTD